MNTYFFSNVVELVHFARRGLLLAAYEGFLVRKATTVLFSSVLVGVVTGVCPNSSNKIFQVLTEELTQVLLTWSRLIVLVDCRHFRTHTHFDVWVT